MATIYVHPTDPTANYSTVAAGVSALASGDTLKVRGLTQSSPSRGGNVISNKSNIVLDLGDSWFTDGRVSSSWSGPSSNVFSLTLASKPKYVVYDLKQDDSSGTVTGVTLTSWESTLCSLWNVPTSKQLPWYGFLTENTVTPTTPSDGEWGHSGGVLYINPPGSPTLSDVISLAQYCPGAATGFYLTGCSFQSYGGNFLLYPDSSTDVTVKQAGYGIRGDACSGPSVISGAYGACLGWHDFGFTGGNGHRLVRCIGSSRSGDISSTGAANSLVFYQLSSEGTQGGHVGEDCVVFDYPLLKTSGAPLSVNFEGNPLISHSDSGTSFNGITWRRILGIDFSDALEAKHGITITKVPFAASHSQGSIGTVSDYTTWPSIVYNSYFSGRYKFNVYNSQTSTRNVFLDRDRTTRALSLYAGASGNVQQNHSCPYIIAGRHSGEFFENMDAGDDIYLTGDSTTRRGKILLQETTNRTGLFGQASDVGGGGANYNIHFGYLDIGSDGSTNHVVAAASNATIYTNNGRDIESLGNNRFGTDLEGTWEHSNTGNAPRDTGGVITWWAANIAGASTDTRAALGWGSTAAAKKAYLRTEWLQLFMGNNYSSPMQSPAISPAFSPLNPLPSLARG